MRLARVIFKSVPNSAEVTTNRFTYHKLWNLVKRPSLDPKKAMNKLRLDPTQQRQATLFKHVEASKFQEHAANAAYIHLAKHIQNTIQAVHKKYIAMFARDHGISYENASKRMKNDAIKKTGIWKRYKKELKEVENTHQNLLVQSLGEDGRKTMRAILKPVKKTKKTNDADD